mmetsp:Transcript_21389/g.39961  ORF Transcript_21389/g.39961 Transcript_21389/m.39961 type:complete len:108 (+) Transcript_21389:1366-1689(+)
MCNAVVLEDGAKVRCLDAIPVPAGEDPTTPTLPAAADDGEKADAADADASRMAAAFVTLIIPVLMALKTCFANLRWDRLDTSVSCCRFQRKRGGALLISQPQKQLRR